MPRAIAGSILKQHDASQGTFRCRAHYLPAIEAMGSSESGQPRAHWKTIATCTKPRCLSSHGGIELLKKSTTLEVRRRTVPEAPSSPSHDQAGHRLLSRRLAAGFGEGWTRFWFTPSDPTTLSAIRLFTGLVVVYLHATLSFGLGAVFRPRRPAAGGARSRRSKASSFSYLNYLSTPGELWTVHLIGLAVLIAVHGRFAGRGSRRSWRWSCFCPTFTVRR